MRSVTGSIWSLVYRDDPLGSSPASPGFILSIYLSINVALYYPSEWTRLKSRNTPERGRGMSGHAEGTLWVSNPHIESPCVAERRRSVGGPHVGRFSLAWWWLRAPYGDPILRPRIIPYRVSNPSRRTSGRSARAPSIYLSESARFSPEAGVACDGHRTERLSRYPESVPDSPSHCPGCRVDHPSLT